MILTPIDQYDKEGNMLGIQFTDSTGKDVVFAAWDEQDAQTSENRVLFREWAYRFVAQLNGGNQYEVLT
jgi:hypothetical protein